MLHWHVVAAWVRAGGLCAALTVGAGYTASCKVSKETEEETEVMRKLRIVVTALCACTAFAVVASAQEKQLCERLGGTPAVSAVVDSFAGKVLKDDRINKKFAKSDANRLVVNLKGFVGQAAHCPGVKYRGKNMKNAHTNMGVTEGEFNALVEDLVMTLDEFKVPEKEKNELLAALGPTKKDIVAKPGDMMTGTDLPANFKPAPPLKKKASTKHM